VPAEFYQAIPKKVVVLESAAELAAALGWTNARA